MQVIGRRDIGAVAEAIARGVRAHHADLVDTVVVATQTSEDAELAALAESGDRPFVEGWIVRIDQVVGEPHRIGAEDAAVGGDRRAMIGAAVSSRGYSSPDDHPGAVGRRQRIPDHREVSLYPV